MLANAANNFLGSADTQRAVYRKLNDLGRRRGASFLAEKASHPEPVFGLSSFSSFIRILERPSQRLSLLRKYASRFFPEADPFDVIIRYRGDPLSAVPSASTTGVRQFAWKEKSASRPSKRVRLSNMGISITVSIANDAETRNVSSSPTEEGRWGDTGAENRHWNDQGLGFVEYTTAIACDYEGDPLKSETQGAELNIQPVFYRWIDRRGPGAEYQHDGMEFLHQGDIHRTISLTKRDEWAALDQSEGVPTIRGNIIRESAFPSNDLKAESVRTKALETTNQDDRRSC